MTLSPISQRSIALFAAALASATLLFGAPAAHAAPKSAYYQVELAQPAGVKKAIVRGVVFQCEGTVCRAPMSASAAKNVCASLAREIGQVQSFKAADRVLDANEMASCNVKTKVYIARD
jgi:hypothetical protein